MKAKVDQDKCFGCGGCVTSIESVFDFNDDGKAHAIVDTVPTEDEEQVKNFVDNNYCPADAISYEE